MAPPVMSGERLARIVVAVTILLVGIGSPAPATTAEGDPLHPEPISYQPPTDGAVLDPFRPPPKPWLAGNRGIEYATTPGSALRAIGTGIVTFAGPVAGRLAITVEHPDGLRSSLTGVALVLVRAGDHVAIGQVVAGAAGTVHLGVRRGDTYLDPASLWGRSSRGSAFLVPFDGEAPSPPRTSDRGPSPDAIDLLSVVVEGVLFGRLR